MKYALAVIVGLGLMAVVVVSEMALIRYAVRCEMDKFVRVLTHRRLKCLNYIA